MTTSALPPTKPAVPPLRNGDHLDRVEFARRYTAMPEGTKAELIDGVVYMAAAVRLDEHGTPHSDLATWAGMYRYFTPGVVPGIETTVRLDLGNEPQPDILLMIGPGRGGRARRDEDGYVAGGPEFVAEVAASSVSIDRNAKLRSYGRNGVQEYVIWRVEQGAIDWFALRAGQYEPLVAGADGITRSEVFPGLWLDIPAMLRGDYPRVGAILQQGLASPEHAAFVARLNPPATP